MIPLAAALICATAAARSGSLPRPQDPEPQPSTASELLRQLRVADLEPAARRRLADEVLALGGRSVDQLFRLASRQFRSVHGDFESLRQSHLDRFAATAVRIVARRQDRATLDEIEALRKDALARSRSADLSKETIRQHIDPAMARLGEILEVDVATVFAGDERLVSERDDLVGLHRDLSSWLAIHDAAGDALAETVTGARKVERDELANPANELRDLDAARLRLAAAATPQSDRDRRIRERNAGFAAELDPEELDGVERTNRLRVLLGLQALAIDPKLCVAARGHSEDMVRLGFFSHDSPVPGKESPGKRAALAGTSGGAENIAAGQRTGAGAIRAWWYSPGHHRNMLGQHGRIGLGRCQSTWTQMFGG